MQQNLCEGARVGRGAPGKFVVWNHVGKIHKLLLHSFEINQRLTLHVITGGGAVWSNGCVRILCRHLDHSSIETYRNEHRCQKNSVHMRTSSQICLFLRRDREKMVTHP